MEELDFAEVTDKNADNKRLSHDILGIARSINLRPIISSRALALGLIMVKG